MSALTVPLIVSDCWTTEKWLHHWGPENTFIQGGSIGMPVVTAGPSRRVSADPTILQIKDRGKLRLLFGPFLPLNCHVPPPQCDAVLTRLTRIRREGIFRTVIL